MSGIYIATRKPIQTRIASRPELTSQGQCKHCGRHFKWSVQFMQQFDRPETEKQDVNTEAMQKFAEYKAKGIGHCCVPRADRILIRNCVGLVVYE